MDKGIIIEIDAKFTYYVYIVTDIEKKNFEVGATSALAERLYKLNERISLAACKYLVHVEQYSLDVDCLKREQRLAELSQRKLKKFVESQNPELVFLNGNYDCS